jgi:hypothetical protein
VNDDDGAQPGSERFLARLVTKQVLTRPRPEASEQGGQQEGALPDPPAMVARLVFVEPEQAEGRQFREGEKDQRPVDVRQADQDAQCA